MKYHEDVVDGGWSVSEAVGRVVRGHKALLVVFALLGTGAGIFYANEAPTTYEAATELVTGTYSLPLEIGLGGALDDAGPLGLELPAETQARIASSPAVVSLAVEALGLEEDASVELLTTVSVRPITDNVFTITAAAPTPEEAAERADAVATAYLQYRQARAEEKLQPFREAAAIRAEEAAAVAAAYQAQIDRAQEGGELGVVVSLTAQQDEYERAAARETALTTTVDRWLAGFNGGGTVVRPADPRTAVGGASLSRSAAAGTAAGIFLGLLTALARERIRTPLRFPTDVEEACGEAITVVTDTGGDSAVVGARTVWRHRRATEAPWELAVVPAVDGRDTGSNADWLKFGMATLGHRVSPAADSHRFVPGLDVPTAPGGEHDATTVPDVRVTAFSDVTSVCLDPAAAPPGAPDVVVAARSGHDSSRDLARTVTTLTDAGLPVIAVILVAPRRRLRRHHAVPRRRVGEPTRAGSALEPGDNAGKPDEHRAVTEPRVAKAELAVDASIPAERSENEHSSGGSGLVGDPAGGRGARTG